MTTITVTVKKEVGGVAGVAKEVTLTTTRDVDMNIIRLNKEIQNIFGQIEHQFKK